MAVVQKIFEINEKGIDYFNNVINKGENNELYFLVDIYSPELSSGENLEDFCWYFVHSEGAVVKLFERRNEEKLLLYSYLELIGSENYINNTLSDLEKKLTLKEIKRENWLY